MALSADVERPVYGSSDRIVYGVFPVAASTKIYNGALVNISATGYVEAAADTASEIPLGIAVEYVDNSSGSDGDLSVKVAVRGCFKIAYASAAITNVGKKIYATADDTIATTASNVTEIGWCINVIAGSYLYLDIKSGGA